MTETTTPLEAPTLAEAMAEMLKAGSRIEDLEIVVGPGAPAGMMLGLPVIVSRYILPGCAFLRDRRRMREELDRALYPKEGTTFWPALTRGHYLRING